MIVFSLAFLIALLLYAGSLDYYFFQDDFFEVNISQAKNLWEYLSFFKFRDDIIAYRPISLQNYFFISQNLFGLNPIGFRLITFILFFSSGFLIYKVIGKVFKSTQTGALTNFFWLTSSIHFMSLTWIAAAYNIIGTFFWLLTSLVFLKYLKKRTLILYCLTFILYFLTVGSFEFSVTWPAIWGFYYFYVLKNRLIKSIKLFSPFITISAIYLLARFLFIKIPQIPEYQISLNIESVKLFFWYALWSFNIPEELKKQVTANLIGFNPIFLAEFWKITVILFTNFLWIIALAVIIPLISALRSKTKIETKLIFFPLAFFSLAISPVLILPNHAFSMYLTLASIGLYAPVAYLLTTSKSQLITFSVLLIWVISSFITISFYRINSWMIEAQKVSQTAVFEIKNHFPSLPHHASVLYYLPFPWQWQALSYQEAIKTIYDNDTLSIYYNEEILREDWKKAKIKGPIYIYNP